MNHLEFLDDCFCLNKDWLKEFLQKYKKENINLPMIVNTRVDLLDEETLKDLKEAGMRELCLGVETGNEGIRKNTLIINLPGSIKGVKDSLELIYQPLPHGIDILTGQDSECG